jgi:hypothetical protein
LLYSRQSANLEANAGRRIAGGRACPLQAREMHARCRASLLERGSEGEGGRRRAYVQVVVSQQAVKELEREERGVGRAADGARRVVDPHRRHVPVVHLEQCNTGRGFSKVSKGSQSGFNRALEMQWRRTVTRLRGCRSLAKYEPGSRCAVSSHCTPGSKHGLASVNRELKGLGRSEGTARIWPPKHRHQQEQQQQQQLARCLASVSVAV